MKVGDLIKNKATGELAIVTGVGKDELRNWITIAKVGHRNKKETEIVYFAKYFNVVSPRRDCK